MTHPVPKGFQLAGVSCGIKADTSKEDLTLIATERDSVAAGVYTTNVVHAACVAQNRQLTPYDRFRVVVINSGNANACTGDRGKQDTMEMARLAGEAVGAQSDQALVMSTGIIGEYLPMEKIAAGIAEASSQLGCDDAAFESAARGMLTTDQGRKTASRSVTLRGKSVRITAMAKGAGMIGPNMATMLCAVMTDAVLSADAAQTILAQAVHDSFNCMSVEGHMSTSDTVLLLASGGAEIGPANDRERNALQQAVTGICVELARMIASDGEGASHLITIDVQGCATREDAHRIGTTVANSLLVKAGVAGADPNWGRIVSAAGYSGVRFNPERFSLLLNGTLLFDGGTPVEFDEAAVSQSIRDNHETHLVLTLAEGDSSIRVWSSDLTVDYVRFNSEYTT